MVGTYRRYQCFRGVKMIARVFSMRYIIVAHSRKQSVCVRLAEWDWLRQEATDWLLWTFLQFSTYSQRFVLYFLLSHVCECMEELSKVSFNWIKMFMLRSVDFIWMALCLQKGPPGNVAPVASRVRWPRGVSVNPAGKLAGGLSWVNCYAMWTIT